MNFRLPSGLGLFDKVGNAQSATSCLAVFVPQGSVVLARGDFCQGLKFAKETERVF